MLQDIATTESTYNAFIEKVTAAKLVWGLQNKNGWANSYSNEDEEIDVIPFWSDRASAKACAVDDWRGYSPVSIPLADFLENWCVGMIEEEILAGINWDANMLGIEADATTLAIDILNQLNTINSAIGFQEYSSIDDFIVKLTSD